jgi:hypothetical protein
MTSNINNNNNVNNLVNQIIFPSDMELRKIKKKKKKSNYKKKKAKEDLRDTLKAYDQSIETAKQNNIKLPQQLGTLPTSLPQINSIREMNQLTDDLRQRIVQINELVSSEKEPTPEELRMIRFRKQMGLESESPLKQPQQPQIIPSSIPQQQPPQIIPSVIPQQEPIQIIPSSIATGQVVVPSISILSADQKSEIDNIETEIMESQNPADKIRLEARLKMMERAKLARDQKEKQAQTLAEARSALTDDTQFIKASLQQDSRGTYSNSAIMPVGFDDLWNPIRQLYEGLIFDFTQGASDFVGGKYRLDETQFETLQAGQEQLRTQFNSYISGLSPLQKQFLEGRIFQPESEIARQFLAKMEKILNTDFKTQFIEHLTSMGEPANPQLILIGAEKTADEQEAQLGGVLSPTDDKLKQEFEKKFFDLRQQFSNFNRLNLTPLKKKKQDVQQTDPDTDEINYAIQELNQLRVDLDTLFNNEPDLRIRDLYMSDKNEVIKEYNKMVKELTKLIPKPDAGPKEPEAPREKGLIKELKSSVKTVSEYLNDTNIQFTANVKSAIINLLTVVTNEGLRNKWRKKSTTRGRSRNETFIQQILSDISDNKETLFKKIKYKNTPPPLPLPLPLPQPQSLNEFAQLGME